MKHIQKINEKFLHNWRKKDELIQSIWDITEDDIFNALVDLEDLYEVEINCEFFLLSPTGKKIQLTNNDEKMEAYAASGFVPIVGIYIDIVGNNDIRMVKSTAIDCVKSLGNWFIFDMDAYSHNIDIKMAQEQEGEKILKKRDSYHKKLNNFFNDMFPEFKKSGYKIIINKVFEKNNRYYQKPPDGPDWQVKKLYGISLEKTYNIDLKMIDELSELKKCLITCMDRLSVIEDFYDISYSFDMEKLDSRKVEDLLNKSKHIEIKFGIYTYEK